MKYQSGSGKNPGSLNKLAILAIGLGILWLTFRFTNKNLNPPETIRAVLKANNYSDLMVRGWIAVSRLETGNWVKSPKLFGEYNNGFGMGVPKVRKSLANGSYFDRVSNMRYSTYSTFANSVRDVVLWMQYVKFPEPCDPSDFAQQLISRGYATDPNYGIKIQTLMA